MAMKDGLSQYDRIRRMTPLESFQPLDCRMETLLRQAEEIAAFIRYYNPDMEADGHFDAFLDEIKQLRLPDAPLPDGTMEPSQALLYTFARNLNEITDRFNHRWKEQFIPWYMDEILGIKPLPLTADSTWVSFQPGTAETIRIPKGQRFTWSEAGVDERIYYSLTEDTEVNAIRVEKACLLYLEKSNTVYPANLFDFPIALHKKEYISDTANPDEAFAQSNTIQSVGLQICSPSFLLESGKRKVILSLQAENQQPISFGQKRKIVELIHRKKQQSRNLNPREIRESVYINLLKSLFHLKISTAGGWALIKQYTVNFENNQLNVTFVLEESFPPTTACSKDIHKATADYPALRIQLDHNAWLYPYAWLKNFFIKKIIIHTHVDNIANLLLYNDLGMVDISKPFCPFGANTEKGSWFAIGNYEMARKKLQAIDVKIQWQQLPRHENGLQDYYYGYEQNITNKSFKIRPEYLVDYQWQPADNTEDFYLFSTVVKDAGGEPEANGKLTTETVWENIRMKDMLPVQQAEENYRYTNQAKNGFFRFELESPDMGLGEKQYRRVYTKAMMYRNFRRRKENVLNEPLNPLINRITLSYRACDEIDLRTCSPTDEAKVFHIYSLGDKQIYPRKDNKPLPFVHSLDHDFNALFALSGVKGDEMLNLYLELQPLNQEVSLSGLPALAWYWGDGYHWQRLPDDAILRNTTQNLLTSGFLRFYIPPVPEDGFRDADGLLWIKAGVAKNARNIAPLVHIHTNVARVKKDASQLSRKRVENFTVDESEKAIPGITGLTQIVPFGKGHESETQTQRSLRLSEYITHRQRAVTSRDYERITLQAFPEIEKVKCLYDAKEKKVVLIIIPHYIEGQPYDRPCATPELLLEVEKYFRWHTPATVRAIDARHPVYEEIIIRCETVLIWTNYSSATSRSILTKAINQLIAPWQNEKHAPRLGYSFTLQDMRDKICRLDQVDEIKQLSVIHLYQDKDGNHLYREHTHPSDIISPSTLHGVLVPGEKHIFVSRQKQYGLEEMNINENFII